MVAADKLPPFDVEAEEACIAAIMLEEEAIARIDSILDADDFYRDQHRWCYEAALDMWQRDKPVAINEVTLAHELARREKLDDVGGIPFLARITGELPTAIGVEHYARIVKRDSTYRHMVTAGSQIVQMAYQGGPDLDGAITRSENLIMALREAQRMSDLVPLRQLLDEFWDAPSPLGREANTLSGVRCGFMDLDTLLGGFHRSDLIICAARPSVGKSALLLNFARNAAVGQNANVCIFTIEMAGEQLAQRLLAAESGVDASRLRLGQMSELEERRAMHATGELSGLNIYIDDSSIVTVGQLHTKLRRLGQQIGGIDLVIIDYLQLMQGAGRHRDNRVQEVSEISRGLKMLARELEVPIIAAAQLSRAPEMRQPHIPMLSDLRESGSIEQDADVVMFIYREDIYVTREDWEMRNFDAPYPEGITKLIVAKHRNGPTGVVHLRFRSNLSRFEDLVVVEEESA